jgi:hypothetical protein
MRILQVHLLDLRMVLLREVIKNVSVVLISI